MTCSFVFVDQTFSSLTVHDRLHFVKCFLCSSFVASFDSCVYFLDESTPSIPSFVNGFVQISAVNVPALVT